MYSVQQMMKMKEVLTKKEKKPRKKTQAEIFVIVNKKNKKIKSKKKTRVLSKNNFIKMRSY